MKKYKIALAILFTITIAMTSSSALAQRQPQEQELEAIHAFLNLMENYLTVADRYVTMVSAEETTMYLVIERIIELYEQKGSKAKAIPELRRLLVRYQDNTTVRNLVHFKIAEIYKDSGQPDKALEELNEIIEENR